MLDDRLLIEELLVGLPTDGCPVAWHTTAYWYYRACRAATTGAGGHLSGPFQQLALEDQERAILDLLVLRPDIGLPDPRLTVPAMVNVARQYPRLNLLNLEAVAAARVLDATVWLSERGSEGILPPVLDAEGIVWRIVTVE